MKYIASIYEQDYLIEMINEGHISLNGKMFDVNFESVSGQPVYSLIVNGKSFEAYVYPGEDDWQVLLHGRLYPVFVQDEREKRLRATANSQVSKTAEFNLKSPMPGLVISIPIVEGQIITQGQVLLILESMKMQNELKAPRDGVVGRIRVKSGDSVENKQILLSVI